MNKKDVQEFLDTIDIKKIECISDIFFSMHNKVIEDKHPEGTEWIESVSFDFYILKNILKDIEEAIK